MTHPPKNRCTSPLTVLQIKIEHADGVIITNPNGIAVSAMLGMNGETPVIDTSFLPAGTDVFDPLTIKPKSGLRSMISDEPAVLYASDDLEIALSPEELFRFIKHGLYAHEFFTLRDRYGLFYEIHEDFYDPETGVALQPMDEDGYEAATGLRD